MFARSNYGILVLRERMTALLSSAVVLVLSNSTYETNFFFLLNYETNYLISYKYSTFISLQNMN